VGVGARRDRSLPSVVPEGALVEERDGDLGPGRLRRIEGKGVSVEYFDHPGPGGSTTTPIRVQRLRRALLTPQTRVHVLEEGGWRHGRVVEHDLESGRLGIALQGGRSLVVSEADVVVRWRRRLTDATELLADRWVESRRFYDARSGFVAVYLARRSAYQNLTAVSSSSVEVHAHQLEAMRKILTDASPRYLLADEVGLGKTIEAGLLVRQFLLDGNDGNVLVVVPPALVLQWEAEFDGKLRITQQFPGRCTIISFDQLGRKYARGASLLVVDEAHRVARADDASAQTRYDQLRELARGADGLLLLSATPLLQDPRSLQRLLHLLSPLAYPLEDLPAFEAALEARDDIATYLGNMTDTAPPVFLRAAIEGLRTVLADDHRLATLLGDVESALLDGDEDRRRAAVRRARSHVAEAHRIHNRMVRSRRGVGLAEEFPVLGRQEPELMPAENSLRDVIGAFNAWHEHVLAHVERASDDDRARTAREVAGVVESLSAAGDALADAASQRRLGEHGEPIDAEEGELLEALEGAARTRAEACPRTRTATQLAVQRLRASEKVAIAAGTDAVAAAIQRQLVELVGNRRISRICAGEPDAVETFCAESNGAVLVFGPSGEEGQNLQAAETVIHVDCPWDPNRLEQRIGRFDRFGPGLPARQFMIVDDYESVANAWVDVLRDGFRIFAESIASLQLTIDRLLPSLVCTAVLDGPAALRSRSEWVADELERELAAVELAELLDETVVDDRGRRLLESVEQAESRDETASWRDSVIRWAAGDDTGAAHLRFHHKDEDNFKDRFALTRFENPSARGVRPVDLPLVPWADLHERFAGAMDQQGAAVGTFRRATAVPRKIRLFGPGDPFIDALWAFAEVEDRGRSFALWRAHESWREREEMLALCFDFRVRPDVAEALDGFAGSARKVAESDLRRRAESYLAPISTRVWLDRDGLEIEDIHITALLNAPFDDSHGDYTIPHDLWHRLQDHIPAGDWASFCRHSRDRSLEVVMQRHDLVEICNAAASELLEDSEDAAARVGARKDATSDEAQEAEHRIGKALAAGLSKPLAVVDATGVVLLAAEPLPVEPK
jgi:ATP-dependent helicase HepA